jgi:hypothetical protein
LKQADGWEFLDSGRRQERQAHERLAAGKVRGTSLAWDEPKALLECETLQVWNRDRVLLVTRQAVDPEETAADQAEAAEREKNPFDFP